jgi:L-fucose mutarotase/ribose pyranase (RbsD/FucU family)
MDLVNKDKNSGMETPPVWSSYQQLLDKAEGRKVEMTKLERWILV